MSFLQPAMLLALPVIALPIIIHLINQRRFQTVQWGAMQFLLAANRMSRGYARLRQWLILAARTLAIAGLIFAISRPLSSGWLGVAGGGKVDTTIILLDRSPSMSELGPGGVTKLDSGVAQLIRSFETLGSSRYVLIDSVGLEPREFESPQQLREMSEASAASASADLPSMLEAADNYIRVNRPSRCEVWIVSDVRRHDWKDDSGRWDAIRESLAELPQMVRFHLLAYPEMESANRSIRVTQARRVEGADEDQLLLSMRIEQETPVEGRVSIPVRLELNGAQSELNLEMTGTEMELLNYPVPLDGAATRGWGRVSIPADATPYDNEFYFVYDREVARNTLIVTEDEETSKPLEFAAAISPDAEITCTSNTIAPGQFLGQALDEISLVVWQAAVPKASDPEFDILRAYVDRGGQVMFFPPESPTTETFAGLGWADWIEPSTTRVATWVGDQGLLTKTRSGAALPVGELKVSRYCGLTGDRRTLATLDGGAPLLARAITDNGGVFFCTTTASPNDSTFATSGVVLYAMIQRAVASGAETLGNTRQLTAGAIPAQDAQNWTQVAGDSAALSNAYASIAGVYQDGDQWFALNRSEEEDVASIVPDERVNALFNDLDFDRVDDQAGSNVSLIQEVWRLFLILMLVALMLEAVLCIPKRVAASTPGGMGGVA
ncbi:MAG: BatA domain-containing protein [Rubripirellula sp.]